MFTVFVSGVALTYWAFTKLTDRARRGGGEYNFFSAEEEAALT
jgi:hypothetical protein